MALLEPNLNNQIQLLGFYLAEGSCSDRSGIRLAIGKRNQAVVAEFTSIMTKVFGIAPKLYESYDEERKNISELRIVNRIAVLSWQHIFGFDGVDSITKKIPDIVFNVAQPLQEAFLRG